MKKNMVALTVLMALSATAHAELKDSENTLKFTGKVVVEGCAFEDGTADGQVLTLNLDDVSLATVTQMPTDVLATIGAADGAQLVCPPGIKSVQMAFNPLADSYDGTLLLNNLLGSGRAIGVGFKVKAAFGNTLAGANWIDFANPAQQSVTVDASRKVPMIFGANYALAVDSVGETQPGNVEASLPFTISYE